MSKVFIIQDTFHDSDFSSASRYGSLHFLLSKKDSRSRLPPNCILKIRKKLREEFDYEKDYIIWAGGDPLANLMAGIVIGVLRFPKINFLKWEKEKDLEGNRVEGRGFYTPVEIKCY